MKGEKKKKSFRLPDLLHSWLPLQPGNCNNCDDVREVSTVRGTHSHQVETGLEKEVCLKLLEHHWYLGNPVARWLLEEMLW